jgi:hypothetical protein
MVKSLEGKQESKHKEVRVFILLAAPFTLPDSGFRVT